MVGNPNAGKTTLFNTLTGSSQKVGNYPGVTVERISATLKLDGETVDLIDVPGLYSMEAVSEDELVAAGVILGTAKGERPPDLLLCVMDAGNLERNLFFFSQIAEIGKPIVVALTMTDLLSRHGKSLDIARLASQLGVDVIPVVAHKRRGIEELLAAISRNLVSPSVPNRELEYPHVVEAKVSLLRERFARSGLDFSRVEIRSALLGPDEKFLTKLEDFADHREAVERAKEELEAEGLAAPGIVMSTRYQWAAMIQKAVISDDGKKRLTVTDRVDYILTHRVFGLLAFGGIMYLVFQSIYTFAGPLMTLIEMGISKIGDLASKPLEPWPVAQSLIVDGIINGVGSALVFLPQIVILFFFISILEGTGYLARAAFLMDKLLGWCGLSGRAFVPLLSSFACAIPGIMAARVMPDQRSRLATILVAPLMSCSARLPVYLLLIGAFIEPQFGPGWAGFTLFAMHLLGLLVAIPIMLILNRGFIRGKRLPFLLELPPYQVPKGRDIWISIFFRAKTFLQTAGTIIVVMSVLIWALLYFPRSDEARASYVQEYSVSHPGASEEQIDAYVQGR